MVYFSTKILLYVFIPLDDKTMDPPNNSFLFHLFYFYLGACYILFGEYVYISDNVNNTFKPDHTYPGVAFFLQNIFIFLSSITFKFGRSEDLWGWQETNRLIAQI